MKLNRMFIAVLVFLLPGFCKAQCTTTNATSCTCLDGSTDCDLLPDITVARPPLMTMGTNGNIEYSQSGNGANNGRLRISASTPNLGYGPLEVRAQQIFVCGTDTITGTPPALCPNGDPPKQLLKQRVYHKNGNLMQYYDRDAGTMTFHPTHGHMHVDDWGTYSLRSMTSDPNPLNWPIVGQGAKLAFCLMDYGSCSTYNGHCVDSNNNVLTNGNFPNYGLGGGSYNCSATIQGISSGYTDIYYQYLDGMYIDIPPGTCNGQYYIVVHIDPHNYFLESNENNNVIVVPFTLTQQVAQPVITGGGDICLGQSLTLTASGATSYLWSTGETMQSITVVDSGSYTVSDPSTGCTSFPEDVTVRSVDVSASANPPAACAGQQIQLDAVVSTTAESLPQTFSTSVPVSITDYSNGIATPVNSPIVVSGISPATLSPQSVVSVTINISHTYDQDLEIRLVAPSGQSVMLCNRRGGSGNNFTGTVFDMDASASIISGSPPFSGTFRPEGDLSTLIGNANGTWNLRVTDFAGADVGQILGWSISLLNETNYLYSWTSAPAGFSSNIPDPVAMPGGHTIYTVTVTSPVSGCTGSADVKVNFTPGIAVTSFSPSGSGIGSTVSIDGAGFLSATSVTIGGVPVSSFTNQSNTLITAVVAPGTTSGVICVHAGNCQDCSSSSFTVLNSYTLNLKLFIEGFYRPGGTMAAVIDPVNFPQLCDTITVGIAQAAGLHSVVFTARPVLDIFGNCSVEIPSAYYGSDWYILIRHRNSLETWSASPVMMNSVPVSYDFTTAASKAYGNMQKQCAPGIYGICSGDINQDGRVEMTDLAQTEAGADAVTRGYVVTDVTGDRVAESADYSLVENNASLQLYMMRP